MSPLSYVAQYCVVMHVVYELVGNALKAPYGVRAERLSLVFHLNVAWAVSIIPINSVGSEGRTGESPLQ